MRRCFWMLVCVVACSKPAKNVEAGSGGSAPAQDPCSAEALGLTGANKLERWTLPQGCTVEPARTPTVIPDQAAFDTQIKCAPGEKPFGQPLVVTTRSFSPAQVGLQLYDDGKTITLVSVQRSPCPGDPRPMPGPDETFAYPITGDTTRAFAERACTLKQACP